MGFALLNSENDTQGPYTREPANNAPFPSLPPPTFIQIKNYFIKNYSISFIFAFQGHQKCVFKVSGEAKMQTFPLLPTMVVHTISNYIENKTLAPNFLKTCSRL